MKGITKILLFIFSSLIMITSTVKGQKSYFIDGYHGGVYGHYPPKYTAFVDSVLKADPFWKINLEIEPETWDSVRVHDPVSLAELQRQFNDVSSGERIEFVNPAYGQSYLYNISGESIIRQFYYGMKKIRQYFPNAVFTAYSSEEPCFTSALPQILKSFGFKYASLKNPNTCWGGYMRAYGGELVNWIGPDGTSLLTVPRYKIEALEPNSTWQTIAWGNSKEYLTAAWNAGIKNPVGMCLQDAGWRNGPWLGDPAKRHFDTRYITWNDYFETVSADNVNDSYKFSQEDVLVSLVWGSQVLQQIAQKVRKAENKIVIAEKLSALANIYKSVPVNAALIDEAWRTLLLSQHHDCWIVPYNGRPGDRWIEKVNRWTATTENNSQTVIDTAINAFSPASYSSDKKMIRVFNTTLGDRTGWASVKLNGVDLKNMVVFDANHKKQPSQIIKDENSEDELLFKVKTPSLGYNSYWLETGIVSNVNGAAIKKLPDGKVVMETDLYKMIIDPLHGGTIYSLIAKTLGNKEFVKSSDVESFNELKGNFYNDGGFHSNKDIPAHITILDSGCARISLQIAGLINGHPCSQIITLSQGDPKIDMQLTIDWKGNTEIGANPLPREMASDRQKAFYDDSKKLLLLFPLNLSQQKVYKNAPFDVTESHLSNTFFQRWDSIKNNIILNWVDVCDGNNQYGMALLTDHTTSYTHGENFPLGLTVQYSGAGLWGRNYTIEGPTHIHYALIPHKGRWDVSGIEKQSMEWNEPLQVATFNCSNTTADEKSFVNVSGKGWQVTTMLTDGNDLKIRIYNAEGNNEEQKITVDVAADAVVLEDLNGMEKQKLNTEKDKTGKTVFKLSIPRYGIRTLKLINIKR